MVRKWQGKNSGLCSVQSALKDFFNFTLLIGFVNKSAIFYSDRIQSNFLVPWKQAATVFTNDISTVKKKMNRNRIATDMFKRRIFAQIYKRYKYIYNNQDLFVLNYM